MRDLVTVEIEKMYDDVVLPEYKCKGDSGMDIRAYFTMDYLAKLDRDRAINEKKCKYPDRWVVSAVNMTERSLVLEPGRRLLIPTGIKTAIPIGYEIQVRPRSGLALKNGITVLNTPGTIDSGYRNEYGVIVKNASGHSFKITHGDRIAQLVLMPVPICQWELVQSVSDTDRVGGFGHTGVL